MVLTAVRCGGKGRPRREVRAKKVGGTARFAEIGSCKLDE